MKQFYFIYKRVGKKSTLNLWAIVEEEDWEEANSLGQITYFVGDFKYEWVNTIEITINIKIR